MPKDEFSFSRIRTRKIASDGSVSQFPTPSTGRISSTPCRGSVVGSTICDFSAESIAAHLTTIDIELFRKIKDIEFLSCGWCAKDKSVKAPNIVAMVRQWNSVGFYVVDEVLRVDTAKGRSDVLHHLIKICKKLLCLNNLNSLKSIICAMSCTSIYRLEDTWDLVLKKDKDRLQKYVALLSEANNCEKLRSHILSSKLPCIPYLGMYLTDLMYYDTLYPSNGGLDIERNKKMRRFIVSLVEFQNSDYGFLKIDPEVLAFFRKERYIDELRKHIEDRQYSVSLRLEPHEGKDSATKEKPRAGRKSHSRKTCLSDNIRSINLNANVNNFDQNVNLVDGSPTPKTPSTANSTPRKLRLESFNSGRLSRFSHEHSVHEGFLKRSVILSNIKKSDYKSPKRLWVVATSDCKMFHYPTSSPLFSCISAAVEKSACHKEINLSDFHLCVVFGVKNMFNLVNEDKSLIYQYRAKNDEDGAEWVQHLTSLCMNKDAGSVNLISFESVQSLDMCSKNDVQPQTFLS